MDEQKINNSKSERSLIIIGIELCVEQHTKMTEQFQRYRTITNKKYAFNLFHWPKPASDSGRWIWIEIVKLDRQNGPINYPIRIEWTHEESNRSRLKKKIPQQNLN